MARSIFAAFTAIATCGIIGLAATSCPHRRVNVQLGVESFPLYLAGNSGEPTPDQRGVTMKHLDFTSVVKTCEAPNLDPEGIQLFHLLGRTLTYTVDLSQVGCACNLAAYLISGPARTPQGEPNPGQRGDYYCDANGVGGEWCPEIDLMEANNRVLQATPHVCSPFYSPHYYVEKTCDKFGCSTSTRKNPIAYGPGSQFEIDTRFPFKVSTYFQASGATLTGVKTLLYQDSRRHVLIRHVECHPEYLAKLSRPLIEGMQLVFSYWGNYAATMAWMDMPPCGNVSCIGGTPGAGDAVITDIVVMNGPHVAGVKADIVGLLFDGQMPPPTDSASSALATWRSSYSSCLAALAVASVSIGAVVVLRFQRKAAQPRAAEMAQGGPWESDGSYAMY